MNIMHVVAILLVLQMCVLHTNKIMLFYFWAYKKLRKPKFAVNERVMIADREYEILAVNTSGRPYTYFCSPINTNGLRIFKAHYHESELKRKTGLLKELE